MYLPYDSVTPAVSGGLILLLVVTAKSHPGGLPPHVFTVSSWLDLLESWAPIFGVLSNRGDYCLIQLWALGDMDLKLHIAGPKTMPRLGGLLGLTGPMDMIYCSERIQSKCSRGEMCMRWDPEEAGASFLVEPCSFSPERDSTSHLTPTRDAH